MNKEAVRVIVSDKLNNITFKENDNLLIGTHVFNQYVLGTYFIDFGDNDISENLRDYQEKHVSSDYYKIPGYLQWNYYLIFLREKYDEHLKQEIEKDAIYTRKFVFTPDEFNDYFEYKHSEQVVDLDIISVWKEKLRNVDLDEAFLDTPYAQAIPRFLSEEVIKEIETDIVNIETKKNLVINKITSINLNENFRKYPLDRQYSLGQVNLLTGVNGTGKTSFLESIELIITGKNKRATNFNEEYGSIEAIYNNEFSDIYTPGDNAKYRIRDQQWYSSAYKSGNELFRAFSKYNFYDSDAAYSLSHNSDVKELSSYLSSIALGTEFKRIQDRLQGFKERLNKEQRIRLNKIEEEKERIKESRVVLQNTKLISPPEENFQIFLSFSKQIKWVKELPKTHNNSFSGFTDNYQTTQSIINSLNQLLEKFKLQKLLAVKDELSKLETVQEDCLKIKVDKAKVDEIINSKRKDYEAVNLKFQILDSAKKFYNEESSFSLWKLEDRIDNLLVKIKKEERALDHFEKVNNQKIFEKNTQFEFFKKEQLNRLQELKENRKELNAQIINLKANLNKLQQVVSDIKSYGKQYLTFNQNADACPLCDTPFSFEELSSRISKIANSVSENVALDKLNDQLIALNVAIENIEEIISNIQHIESGISIISAEDYEKLSLSEIRKVFDTTKNRLEKNIEDRSSLIRLKQELDDKELYENDFSYVKKEIENTIPEIKFSYEDVTKFQALFSRFEKERDTFLEDIRKAEEKAIELNNSLRNIFEQNALSINFYEYESELAYRIELLQKGIVYFKDLADFLSFSEEEPITDISQKIDKLFKLYESLNNSISSQKELKLANQIISKSEGQIKLLEPECIRISKGLEIIDDILENHGEAKVLGDFIKNNENEIQEIFQNIHSPKEFTSIKFDISQNSVLLKKRIDNTEVPISKISTGQRSALALSIFLALNKKLKHGPNIILFDDPVTFTDDLNILSFLDYLRELIINENRQVVFATANQKLAGLFEKKFAFLGEENFKQFHFER